MPDPAVNTPETLRVREATLVRSIAGGDDGALGDAFDRYGSLVYGVALRVLGAASDAEEVLQDVFVQLWRRAAQFDAERGSLAGFLATLARNAAIDRLRSRRS
ncbi:MAG TPA: sigma-70 family RNA polymerase sigma factor, partial [Planctomycetota bacterium]|nr:sigma-70 family RNA polymerase sigma factor [Planctomycetota bacterium]